MMWSADKEYSNYWNTSKEFDGITYFVEVWVEVSNKSRKYWFGASSGRKRRDLEVFEQKNTKSLVGLKPLMWIKSCIYNFPKFYLAEFEIDGYNQYICIAWSDSRRKKIYSRLLREGFRFGKVGNINCLIKRV